MAGPAGTPGFPDRPRRLDRTGLGTDRKQARVPRGAGARPRSLFEGEAKAITAWQIPKQQLLKALGDRSVRWALKCKEADAPIPVSIGGIRFWASAAGLGYLAIDLELRGDGADADVPVADFLDVLHHARYLDRRGLELIGTLPPNERRPSLPARPWFLGESGEWSKGDDHGATATGRLPTLVRQAFSSATGRPPEELEGAMVENSRVLRAYSTLALRTIGNDSGDDERRLMEIVSQVAEMAPAKRRLERIVEPDLAGAGILTYRYARGALIVASHESTAFVAIDQPDEDFWRDTMHDHMLVEYFMIQLLTMYQRHVADEIRRLAANADGTSEDLWEQLERRSIDLKARGYFLEISVRTNHARFEAMVRRLLHVDRAYRVASGLVDSLCETHIAKIEKKEAQEQERRERQEAEERERRKREQAEEQERREGFLQLVAVIAIVPSLVLTYLNINLNGITTEEGGMHWLLPLLLALGFLLLTLVLLGAASRLRRRAISAEPPSKGVRGTGPIERLDRHAGSR